MTKLIFVSWSSRYIAHKINNCRLIRRSLPGTLTVILRHPRWWLAPRRDTHDCSLSPQQRLSPILLSDNLIARLILSSYERARTVDILSIKERKRERERDAVADIPGYSLPLGDKPERRIRRAEIARRANERDPRRNAGELGEKVSRAVLHWP